ncbi:unnamed protein product [Closterium sp. NIES-64]|nr:unnamed protein product [Closterium sp. NIES-64]
MGVYCTDTGKVATIHLHYNYLYEEIPSFLVALLKLTLLIDCAPLALLPPPTSGMVDNYLVESVPAMASQVRILDVGYNFLTDVPAVTYTFCGGTNNCLLTPSKCTNSGTTQRPAADCAICGTTNGVGPFCWGAGGVCTANASIAMAASTVNVLAQPSLPLACMGGTTVPMKESATLLILLLWPASCGLNLSVATRLSQATTPCLPATLSPPAMLTLKPSLGVTFNNWAATVSCALKGMTPSMPTWSKVVCNDSGNVVSM